jgi:hypothetical protein
MVSGHPASLLACRYYGLNQPQPEGTLASTARLSATPTAALLNSAPVVDPKSPAPSCPAAFGDEILLIFRYRHPPDLWVTVQMSGCSFITNGARTAFPDPPPLRTTLTNAVGQDPP